jgi:putative redox protein
MTTTRIEFEGALGEPLAAALDWPSGPTRAFALFAHCFTCSKDLFASKRVSNALTAHGFAVLRFDFTGLGKSGGEFANTSFSSNAADLVAAADWLKHNHEAPSLMVGHSLGGAAVLAAAREIESVMAVATIGAPSSADHVLRHFKSDLDAIRRDGEAQVEIGGRPFTVKKQFLDDAEGANLTLAIEGMRAALLVLHSPVDQTVGIENAEAIFRAARHPKSFVSLDKADHLLTEPEDSIYAADIIATWGSRFLPARVVDESVEGKVVVSESGEGPYHLSINASGHLLSADEPESVGGTGRGPTPYDLLCAALGACTTITLRMYAKRKELQVESIQTEVDHEKRHAEDSADAEGETKRKIDVFTRRIWIFGGLTEVQRERMLQIADLCPVHKTLEAEANIKTELAE